MNMSHSNYIPINDKTHHHFGSYNKSDLIYQHGCVIPSRRVVPFTHTSPCRGHRLLWIAPQSSRPQIPAQSHTRAIGRPPSVLHQRRLEVKNDNTILHSQMAKQEWRLNMPSALPMLQ